MITNDIGSKLLKHYPNLVPCGKITWERLSNPAQNQSFVCRRASNSLEAISSWTHRNGVWREWYCQDTRAGRRGPGSPWVGITNFLSSQNGLQVPKLHVLQEARCLLRTHFISQLMDGRMHRLALRREYPSTMGRECLLNIESNLGLLSSRSCQNEREKWLASHHWIFQFMSMPVVLKEASRAIRHTIDINLSTILQKLTLVYVDGIVIFLNKLKAHNEQLGDIMLLLCDIEINTKMKTREFFWVMLCTQDSWQYHNIQLTLFVTRGTKREFGSSMGPWNWQLLTLCTKLWAISFIYGQKAPKTLSKSLGDNHWRPISRNTETSKNPDCPSDFDISTIWMPQTPDTDAWSYPIDCVFNDKPLTGSDKHTDY